MDNGFLFVTTARNYKKPSGCTVEMLEIHVFLFLDMFKHSSRFLKYHPSVLMIIILTISSLDQA